MALIAKDSPTTPRALVPSGAHIAICIGVYDLGLQEGGAYGPKPTVMFRFEVPEETVERDGRSVPLTLNREFTVSLSEKSNLRPFLEGWRGRPFTEEELAGFSLENVLSKPCMVNVIHVKKGEKTYDNIKSVMPIPKGMAKPSTSYHEPLLYDRDAPDEAEVRAKLPEWVVKNKLAKIVKSVDDFDAVQDASYGPDERPTPPIEDEIPF